MNTKQQDVLELFQCAHNRALRTLDRLNMALTTEIKAHRKTKRRAAIIIGILLILLFTLI